MVPLPPGEAVLVDELGSVVIETLPAAERAVVLELGGELTRSGGERFSGKFLMAPGQVGELIADLVRSMVGSGVDVLEEVKVELAKALAADGAGSVEEVRARVDRAHRDAADRHATVVNIGVWGEGPASEAFVSQPVPAEEFDGDLVCHVRFKGGGPFDGKEATVPVAVAVAAFATHDIEVQFGDPDEEDDGGR